MKTIPENRHTQSFL